MNLKRTTCASAAISLVALIGAVFAAPASAASYAYTAPATEVTATSAVLNGTISADGGKTLYGFQYGTSTEYGSGTQGKIVEGAGGHVVSEKITGLTPGLTYHFSAVAIGGGQTHYGVDETFTTEHKPQFNAELYGDSGAHVDGTPEAGGPFEFDVSGVTFSCASGSYSGNISGPAAELKLTPHFKECEFFGEPASVERNGCSVGLTIANSDTPDSGGMAIACQGAHGIQVTTEACSFELPAQALAGEVAYTAEGTGAGRKVQVDLDGTLTADELSGPLCFVLGEAPFTGSASGSFVLSAEATPPGKYVTAPTGVFITGERFNGVYVSGGGEDPAAIAAEEYPAPLSGSQDGEWSLAMKGGEIPLECGSGSYEADLSAASDELAVSASLGDCTFFGEAASVDMNGCGFVLNVANSGAPYGGTQDIACENPGEAIEVTSDVCSFEVPAQALGGDFDLGVEGESIERSLLVEVDDNEVDIELGEGPLCFLVESEGSLDSAFSLEDAS